MSGHTIRGFEVVYSIRQIQKNRASLQDFGITQILNDIRADFNRIPVVNTWTEAHNAVCTCNYLNHELRTMGVQHVKPDAELITLIVVTNKMQADCFQAITLQVQQRNPHRQTIAAAPLLGAIAQPAQNPFVQAIVQGLAQVGVVIDPMAVGLGPAQPIMHGLGNFFANGPRQYGSGSKPTG